MHPEFIKEKIGRDNERQTYQRRRSQNTLIIVLSESTPDRIQKCLPNIARYLRIIGTDVGQGSVGEEADFNFRLDLWVHALSRLSFAAVDSLINALLKSYGTKIEVTCTSSADWNPSCQGEVNNTKSIFGIQLRAKVRQIFYAKMDLIFV